MLSAKGRREKGDRAEREVLVFLREHLGDHLVRARGEGSNDHGDVAGLPQMAVQVKNYADALRAIREGLEGAAAQKANAGLDWGCAFVRRRGGRWIVVMDPEDWVSMYREAALLTADRVMGGIPDGDERADGEGHGEPEGPVDEVRGGEEHGQRG